MPLIGGMIVLNEEAFVVANLRQHLAILDRLVIVEGADVHYPKHAVSAAGLSLDRTAELVRSFPDPDGKIVFVQHGWAGDGREGHGKVVLRDRALQEALRGCAADPVWFWHMDADEFVLQADQPWLCDRLSQAEHDGLFAVRLPTIHFWKSTRQVVVGGYYDTDHVRFFRVRSGSRYEYRDEGSHNAPVGRSGRPVHRGNLRIFRRRLESSGDKVCHPGLAMYHFGFCRDREEMRAKTDYYRARGEVVSRPKIIADREAWFGQTRKRVRVVDWCGSVPEAIGESHGVD